MVTGMPVATLCLPGLTKLAPGIPTSDTVVCIAMTTIYVPPPAVFVASGKPGKVEINQITPSDNDEEIVSTTTTEKKRAAVTGRM